MDGWTDGAAVKRKREMERGPATTNNLAQRQINKISKQTLATTRQN